MEKVLTADKSETFLNEEVGESYHSFTGAVEEALKKFVEPTKIKEIAKKGEIKILDVCFGLGYNSAMAITVALQENPDCKIEIVGLEKEIEIIKKIQEVNPEIEYYKNYKLLTKENLSFTKENVIVKVLLGDAKEQVKKLSENYFDAVLFDPFSPKTAPGMWTADFFESVKRVMRVGAILATYSCARMVRDNMVKAGLEYFDGPKVGRRGPGTIAIKNG